MNVHNDPLIIRITLTDEVECYALTFLLQCRFWRRQVEKYQLIITVDEIRHIDRNVRKVELASKSLQLFRPLVHCPGQYDSTAMKIGRASQYCLI